MSAFVVPLSISLNLNVAPSLFPNPFIMSTFLPFRSFTTFSFLRCVWLNSSSNFTVTTWLITCLFFSHFPSPASFYFARHLSAPSESSLCPFAFLFSQQMDLFLLIAQRLTKLNTKSLHQEDGDCFIFPVPVCTATRASLVVRVLPLYHKTKQ